MSMTGLKDISQKMVIYIFSIVFFLTISCRSSKQVVGSSQSDSFSFSSMDIQDTLFFPATLVPQLPLNSGPCAGPTAVYDTSTPVPRHAPSATAIPVVRHVSISQTAANKETRDEHSTFNRGARGPSLFSSSIIAELLVIFALALFFLWLIRKLLG